MLMICLILTVLLLAWSNGANDNFKGVATLYGGGIASYRGALLWATATTLAGSLASALLAGGLVKAFSGGGLVPDALTRSPGLLMSIGGAAAATILLATYLGMPTSTTHALTGALVGAALVADGRHIRWGTLASRFAQPLLVSPVVAIVAAAGLYLILRSVRKRLHASSDSCLCITAPASVVTAASADAALSAEIISLAPPRIVLDRAEVCAAQSPAVLASVGVASAADRVHFLTAGAVCFARALNDTPKIAALLVAGGGSALGLGQVSVVALAMTAGGVLGARRVARTISTRITELNSGQGLTASLVTAGLVLGASRLGLPVSTTHVSCGSLFGVGVVNRRHNWKVIAQILAAWVTTLPLGLALGAGVYWLLKQLGV